MCCLCMIISHLLDQHKYVLYDHKISDFEIKLQNHWKKTRDMMKKTRKNEHIHIIGIKKRKKSQRGNI